MLSGDENHIVMNDRVQALAGSIYEEFEQVRSKPVILSDYLPHPVPGTGYSDHKKEKACTWQYSYRIGYQCIR